MAAIAAALAMSSVAPPIAGAVVYLELRIGDANAEGMRSLSVLLRTNGAAVADVQNDLLYDTSSIDLAAESCTIGPDTCTSGSSNCPAFDVSSARCATRPRPEGCRIAAGINGHRVRVSVSRGEDEIPDGTVLYICAFRRRTLSAYDDPEIANVVASNPAGHQVPVSPRQQPRAGPVFDITGFVGAGVELQGRPIAARIADLIGDPLDDVVVASNGVAGLEILENDAFRGTGQAVTLELTETRLLDVGDLDSDGRIDIVAFGNNGDVLWARNLGDGRFAPQILASEIEAEALVLGDFNLRSGLDVLLGHADGYVSVLLRSADGVPTLIRSEAPFGSRITKANVADFNLDGMPDAMLLDSPGSRSAAVVVALGDGTGRLALSSRTPIDGAIDLAIGDFDANDLIDLAVLVDGDPTPSIRVFLRRSVAGVGTDLFEAPPLAVRCQQTFDGHTVQCDPRSLLGADLNSDGYADLATTTALSVPNRPDLMVPGVLQLFASGADGSFRDTSLAQVGPDPVLVEMSEYMGAFPTVVIGEAAGVVRLVTLFPGPEPFGSPGAACRSVNSCSTFGCVDGVCCVEDECSDQQRCDIPASSGRCSTASATGACSGAEHCASGLCVGGYCCSTPSCPEGQVCNTGVCTPPVGLGTECGDGAQCASGACVDGVCCEVSACPALTSCAVPGREGTCTARIGRGGTCRRDLHCDTNLFCADGVCCISEDCGPGRSCNLVGTEGLCAALPSPTATPADIPCAGDCDDSGDVGVDELVILVTVALGEQARDACANGDGSGDGTITVDEIGAAVQRALEGCARL